MNGIDVTREELEKLVIEVEPMTGIEWALNEKRVRALLKAWGVSMSAFRMLLHEREVAMRGQRMKEATEWMNAGWRDRT